MKALRKLLFICVLMAVVGTAAGIFIALKLSQLYTPGEPGWQTFVRVTVDPRSVFPGKDDLYVLILGTDYNYTDKDILYTKNTRSDTMLLVHLDLKDKQMKILSIPRDTRAYIPGHCYKGDCFDKINAAFADGGPRLSEVVVANLTGVPIDNYIRIKEQGLKNLVDAIGGIDVDVDENMDYDDSWGHLHIHLRKGWQHLDGEKAAEYARFRHDPLGDYGRIQRQQQVIKAIAKKLENPMVLTRFDNVVHVAKDNIETDLNFPQILALANLFKGTNLTGLKTLTLPTMPQDVQEFGVWVSYVVVNAEEARKVIGDFMSDEPPLPQNSALTIEVLNGSGMPGMAKDVAEKLRSDGFMVSRVGNADNFNYGKTEIVDHTGKGEGLAVARFFNKDETDTLSVPEDPRQVDVTVIVGKNQQPLTGGSQ